MLDTVPVIKFDASTNATDASTERVVLPPVFKSPVRYDIVNQVHDLIMKNTRQPYARKHKAGTMCSAQSWGVGRAKARVPRIKASGTQRSSQAAYANFTRGGAMFHPLTTNRRWGRLINIKERRIAMHSAIAASSKTPLVMARGHQIQDVPNIPLVMDDAIESIEKTKQAVAYLKAAKCYDDVLKCVASKRQRGGRGKMRNRRYKMKRGPLVIFKKDNGIRRAMRNIPGVSVMQVDSPNLLKLAPGGHVGRLVIWSKSAIESLDLSLGGAENLSHPIVSNTCMRRVLKSEPIRAAFMKVPSSVAKSSYESAKKVNPMRSKNTMKRLNPNFHYFNKTYASILGEISR